MMFPSLRGGNDDTGFNEALSGEVDGVIAARAPARPRSAARPSRRAPSVARRRSSSSLPTGATDGSTALA